MVRDESTLAQLIEGLLPEDTHEEFPDRTTLWEGPYDIFIRPELNIAFPDTSSGAAQRAHAGHRHFPEQQLPLLENNAVR